MSPQLPDGISFNDDGTLYQAPQPTSPFNSPSPQPQGYNPRVANGLWDAAVAGFEGSATGLALRGKLPDVVLDPQHSKWLERLTSSATGLVSELPEMVVGGAAAGVAGLETGPGAIIAAGAGAFAVPTAIRTALTQAYEHNLAQSSGDFLARTAIVAKETAKSALVGGLTAGVGMAAKPRAPWPRPAQRSAR